MHAEYLSEAAPGVITEDYTCLQNVWASSFLCFHVADGLKYIFRSIDIATFFYLN